jgi:hypothetical protein
VLELLDSPSEVAEVNELLVWWNRYVDAASARNQQFTACWSRQVFAEYVPGPRAISQNSPLALIVARRQAEAAARTPLRPLN